MNLHFNQAKLDQQDPKRHVLLSNNIKLFTKTEANPLLRRAQVSVASFCTISRVAAVIKLPMRAEVQQIQK